MIERAVKDAKEKATIMLNAAGCELGALISIEYGHPEISVCSQASNIHSNSEVLACDNNSFDINPDDLVMTDDVEVKWGIING